jgi:hypothetical protein
VAFRGILAIRIESRHTEVEGRNGDMTAVEIDQLALLVMGPVHPNWPLKKQHGKKHDQERYPDYELPDPRAR